MLGTLDQSSIADWARPELIFRLSTEFGSMLALLRKIRIFDACIGSQLLYCLHTAWLNKAFLRQLDGFEARSLRKILGIPHSYLSRVPNVEVLKQAAAKPYSKILMHRQLQLIARIAALPSSNMCF